MSTRSYLGHAAAEKQVASGVVANTWAQNDTATVTIDNLSFTITIGTLVTTAQVATTIKEAFGEATLTDTAASYSPTTGAQHIGQMAEITASIVTAGTVRFTANTAGIPFTMSGSESTAGTGTFTLTNETIAATGPYHFDAADNWSGNTVPIDGDTILFEAGSIGPRYALAPAIQPLAVRKLKAFTGNIGLPNVNVGNASYPYAENRTKALTFDDNGGATCTYDLEVGEGQGSALIRIDAGAGLSIFNVHGAAGRTISTSTPTTLLTGTNTANVLNNFAGDVGFAFYPNEAGVLATVRHGNGTQSTAFTYCGTGVTLTSATITVNGGKMVTNSALSTTAGSVTILAGELHHYAGNVKALTINDGGKFILKAAANITITTLVVNKGGTLDLSNYRNTLTISGTINIYAGANIIDPNSILKGATAAIHLIGCKVSDLGKLDLGTDVTLTLS